MSHADAVYHAQRAQRCAPRGHRQPGIKPRALPLPSWREAQVRALEGADTRGTAIGAEGFGRGGHGAGGRGRGGEKRRRLRTCTGGRRKQISVAGGVNAEEG